MQIARTSNNEATFYIIEKLLLQHGYDTAVSFTGLHDLFRFQCYSA